MLFLRTVFNFGLIIIQTYTEIVQNPNMLVGEVSLVNART